MRFIVIGGGCYGTYHSGQLYKAVQKGKLPAGSQLIIVDRNTAPKAMTEHGDKPGFQFVQSDWQAFLQSFLGDRTQYDPAQDGEEVQIVPAPYAPHLMFDWLRFSTETALHALGREDILVERAAFDNRLNLPYEFTDKVGNHFISRAGWTCPTTCIEPRVCPAVKGVRDWDLDRDLRDSVAQRLVVPSVSAATALATAGLPNGQTALAEVSTEVSTELYDGAETFTCHHFAHGIGTIPAGRLFEARERMVQRALGLSPAHPQLKVAVGTVSHCHGVAATIALSLKTI